MAAVFTSYSSCWRRFDKRVWDPVHSSNKERVVVLTAWPGGVQTKLVEEGSEKYPCGAQTLVTRNPNHMPAEFRDSSSRSVWQLCDAALQHVHESLDSQALTLTQKGVSRPSVALGSHSGKGCWELAVMVPLKARQVLQHAAWRDEQPCDLLEGDEDTYVGLLLLKAVSVWTRTVPALVHQGNIAYVQGAASVALVALVSRDRAVVRACITAAFLLLALAFYGRRQGTPWLRRGLAKGSDWTSIFVDNAHRSSRCTAAVQHSVFTNSTVYSEPRPEEVPTEIGAVGTCDYGWRYVAAELRDEMSALVARGDGYSIGALEDVASTRFNGSDDDYWRWIGGRGDSLFGLNVPSK